MSHKLWPVSTNALIFFCGLIHSATGAESPYVTAWTRLRGTGEYDTGQSVAIDNSNNIYISGFNLAFNGTPFSDDAFLAKYDAAGTQLWSKVIRTSPRERSYGVAVDTLGNAYIGGRTFPGSTLSNDAYLSKYDTAGNLLWSHTFGTTSDDASAGIAVDADGNTYAAGYTYGSLGGTNAGGQDAFITKYDSAGMLLWTRQLGTSGDDEGTSISLDIYGNPFISGRTTGRIEGTNAGGSDAFAAKFDAQGNLIWTQQFGTTLSDSSLSIVVDKAGNSYLTGYTFGSLPGNTSKGLEDAFLTKLDPMGMPVWYRQIGSNDGDYGHAVAIDSAGGVFVGGINFAGADKASLAKFDTNGALLWTKRIGIAPDDAINGIAVDAFGSLLVTGVQWELLDGDNLGDADVFLMKLVVPEPSSLSVVLTFIGLSFSCPVRRLNAPRIC